MNRFNQSIAVVACTVVCLLARAAASLAAPPTSSASGALWVYLGTYTDGASQGIYLAHLDMSNGKLRLAGLAGEAKNPSFLALHPRRPLLYAVGELSEFAGEKVGAVSAFSIEPKTGRLTLLNQQSSGGAGPCHLTVDRTGRCVLVANYSGGSVACLPISEDGRLLEAASFIQHRGSGVDRRRQEGPHAHSINLDAANRFAFAADLGLDRVLSYRFDPRTGKLAPNEPPAAAVADGAGPRHFAFHPTGRWAYVINEMANTVTAFRYDAASGTLHPLGSTSTLPPDFHGTSWTAEVQVHPSGKFLYGSNRGHNSIAIFTIDAATGKLRAAGHEPTRGKTPRNFGMDPKGRYLLAANQDTDNVVVFSIDSATGKLRATGGEVKVAKPVCVKLMPPVE